VISPGGPVWGGAKGAPKAGAKKVIALVTHGLFMPGATQVIADAAIDRFVVTDSMPPFRLDAAARAKIDTLQVAPLLAETVRHLHAGRALTDLLVF
jgi:ribose-phosphate pyrophosphokinase